jgi:Phosphodiester glycosidase
VVVLLIAACARPALAPLAPAAFPFAIDSLRTQQVSDGVLHHYIYSAAGPWAIHVLDVRLDRCYSAVAVKGAPGAVGRAKTSDLMRDLTRTREVIGGVNADFFLFTPAGVPTGAHVTAGRVITPPSDRPVFAIDSTGRPRIAVLSLRDSAKFAVDDPALARVSLLPFHPLEAVGGRPVLTRDSVITDGVDTEGQAGFAKSRHPRTAVGIANDGRRLLLAVVDGRQKPYSDGMTLRELATLMLALGARDALNLDGGGSTAFVYADPDSARALRVANHPSDPTGERAVGNALAIVRGCRAR